MAGWVMANGWASSVTVASPRARRARIALRVGSAMAEKAASRFGTLLMPAAFMVDPYPSLARRKK
jgi:hypothetical protein